MAEGRTKMTKEDEYMGSIYNENLTYSRYTQQLANFYPSWTQIRKSRESIGQQFLNVFGLQLEEIELFLNEALNNQYIGTANLGEIYQLYKFSIPQHWDEDIKVARAAGYIGENEYLLDEAIFLREFYSNEKGLIFDFEKNIGYVHPYQQGGWDRIQVMTNLGNLEIENHQLMIHHVWNVFDELAMLLGLRRRYLERSSEGSIIQAIESNEELKYRILNVFKFPANSQRTGLINGIGQSLGLIKEAVWEENVSSFSIEDPTCHPESLIINGKIPLPGQMSLEIEDDNLVKVVLQPLVEITPSEDMELANLSLIDSKVELPRGIKQGTLTTAVISPSNLEHWSRIKVYGDNLHNLRIEILSYNHREHTDLPIAVGLGDELVVDEVNQPIKVRLILARDSIIDSTPSVSRIEIDYINSESNIEYIHSVKIDAMYDNKFRETLHKDDCQASKELKAYVEELSSVAPILWDQFKWDEAYWDVVDKKLMGLEALPHIWDPYLSEKANIYLQTGIGFGNDLLVRLDDSWRVQIHNGYYYIGDDAEEHYLYASPEVVEESSTDLVILPRHPKQGSPIIVIADGKYLTQVAFLGENSKYQIVNTEVLIPNKDGVCFTTYNNPVIRDIHPFVQYTLSENKLTVPAGTEELLVSYVVEDSFVANKREIILSQEYNDIKVIYESQDKTAFYSAESLSLDPVRSHFNTGFIYLADKAETPHDLIISASPSTLRGNGIDISVITVDILDRYGNPVLDQTITANCFGEGDIVLSGVHKNRHVFRYTAPNREAGANIKFRVSETNLEKSTVVRMR